MTLIQLLIFIVIFAALALGAYWVITKFITVEPARTISLIIVGVVLLVILLSQFMPDVAGTRLWR